MSNGATAHLRTLSGHRRGLTIVEVMIALMVFALVVSAIASSWFSLRSLQRFSQDEAKVHELAQALSERIVGAHWDWIGRDRPDEEKVLVVVDDEIDPQTDPPTTKTISVVERYWRRYAWSWHRREFPRNTTTGTKIRLPPLTDRDWTADDYARMRADTDAPLTTADVDQYNPSQPADERINPHNLVDLGFLERPTGLQNLEVFVEYYHAAMLDVLFKQTLDPTIRTKFTQMTRGQILSETNEELSFPESPFQSDALETQMNPADQKLALQAMVVRIIITWGETRKQHRHEVVMSRRK